MTIWYSPHAKILRSYGDVETEHAEYSVSTRSNEVACEVDIECQVSVGKRQLPKTTSESLIIDYFVHYKQRYIPSYAFTSSAR